MRFRIFSPWLIAAFSCLAVAFFVRGIVSSMPMNRGSRPMEGIVLSGNRSVVPFQNPKSVSDRLIATLSFVPGRARSVPLVAAMIENHEEARAYQKGLKEAAAIFELIAEGDITRFIAFFPSDRLPAAIGPIRSLREHFVSIANGYKPLLLHVGGHPLAYEALANNRELIHHDGIRFDGETYQRDREIPAPHNLFMQKEPLKELLAETELLPFSLPLFPTCSGAACNLSKGKSATKISINMGSRIHDFTYLYKSLFGAYTRTIDGAEKQGEPQNVVILEAIVSGFREKGYIPWTKTFGEGKMLLFRNGKVMEGVWKRDQGKPFAFFDAEGEKLLVAQGQVWVTMLPKLDMVTWE